MLDTCNKTANIAAVVKKLLLLEIKSSELRKSCFIKYHNSITNSRNSSSGDCVGGSTLLLVLS